MAEETTNVTEQEGAEEQQEEKKEEMVMCYVSKRMVPFSETVEVVYSQSKKFRVMPQYIKY